MSALLSSEADDLLYLDDGGTVGYRGRKRMRQLLHLEISRAERGGKTFSQRNSSSCSCR